ncbi:hypothetical protein ECA2892 [Pectobacterium atrosepticum SCRI1043]|uniref:FRG domain-containing protein n=1 Tax=Pectobacterium atrosepticum (strain SCRI 1043 / ATCC BAA-672) TaxID=218491 RepID=Q6D352_PECAS|nr:FRG domain-containing protein [Pectobacterium atrosepticum]MCL6315127.1 FRG domain-containing protein [Pectobacterium atrosepticum]MCL6320637.1 FRG domain-containing protein [Pectobacterium atrosepticum]CAG75792.1 hypothetical protein ECA2892 [Pectobacterium atrosepticum SCRI1043]
MILKFVIRMGLTISEKIEEIMSSNESNTTLYNISSLEHLHAIFRAYRPHNGFGVVYRGQADCHWKLLPKAGRQEYLLPDDRDLGVFKDWLDRAIAYENVPNYFIEQLALAQHHGLATRLLDWTINPLIACYFACCSYPDKDGVIYILELPKTFATVDLSMETLKECSEVISYRPRQFSPRILNQGGIFTIHNPPDTTIDIGPGRIALDMPNLVQIILGKNLKHDILEMLSDYGIDERYIYPDLDGLSRSLNHSMMRMVRQRVERIDL